MVLLLKYLICWYYYVNNELQDPRVKDYPLMSNPFPILGICGFYLYFVKSLGPKLMQNRPPMNIEKFIIVFNISQICICAFLVYKFMAECAFNFNWFCEPVNYGTEQFPTLLVFYSWIYHLIKIFDLLDTVFFVLRKKFSHISFLHLYHHTGMALLTWVGVKFLAGGHGLFLGFANCLVHTFMYFYYLMSIWDEKYKKSIWWKKHITQLQLAQFLFIVVIFGQITFQPSCTYPKWIIVFLVPQNLFMLVLFSDFYYQTYIKKKPLPIQRKPEVQLQTETKENDKDEQFLRSIQQKVHEDELKAK